MRDIRLNLQPVLQSIILFEKQNIALRSPLDTDEYYGSLNVLNFWDDVGDAVLETHLATQNKIGNSERTDYHHMGADPAEGCVRNVKYFVCR